MFPLLPSPAEGCQAPLQITSAISLLQIAVTGEQEGPPRKDLACPWVLLKSSLFVWLSPGAPAYPSAMGMVLWPAWPSTLLSRPLPDISTVPGGPASPVSRMIPVVPGRNGVRAEPGSPGRAGLSCGGCSGGRCRGGWILGLEGSNGVPGWGCSAGLGGTACRGASGRPLEHLKKKITKNYLPNTELLHAHWWKYFRIKWDSIQDHLTTQTLSHVDKTPHCTWNTTDCPLPQPVPQGWDEQQSKQPVNTPSISPAWAFCTKPACILQLPPTSAFIPASCSPSFLHVNPSCWHLFLLLCPQHPAQSRLVHIQALSLKKNKSTEEKE